ncbi:GtrA family protein [Pontiella sp.]|uniref:GtrA family protein n=1 Tax=Pontiella sp. TaxID=2837462 RepID=UPI0035662253
MEILKKMLFEKNHPGIQFLKYAFCGGFAFAADVVTFFIVAWFFFPALTQDDVFVRLLNLQVEPVSDAARTINFVICSALAFMVSNMTAYVLNVLFVFKAGKHTRWKELALFYLVSGISIAIGTGVGALLINVFGLTTTFSYVAKAFFATMINYAGRKFFIFHG